jgi:trypsin-like peptidase
MTRRALLVFLLLALATGSAFLFAQGPDKAEVAAACRASARADLELKVRRALGRQAELSQSAGFEQLVAGRAELLALGVEAARLGAAASALEAEAAAHSPELVARIQRAQAQLLRETQSRLARVEDRAHAQRILNELPPAFSELEPDWVEGQRARVQAWRALAEDCHQFSRGRYGSVPGTAELREARSLLLRATRAGLGSSPEARTLEDWIRRQAGLSQTVLGEEISLRARGRQAQGEAARRLLESLESDLARFFAAHAKDTARLLAVLPSEDLRGFLNAYASPALWEGLSGEDWFPALERDHTPADRIALYELVPQRKWSEVSARRLARALSPLETGERVRCTLTLPAACVRRFEQAHLETILRGWPERFRRLVTRLLPGDLALALDPKSRTSLSLGTAFYVTPHLLLTNAHVVGQAQRVRVDLDSGESISGEVTARDAALDLALIRVAREGTPLRPATSANRRRVRSFGFRERGLRAQEGRVVGADLSARKLVFSGRVESGDSGGPLLDAAGAWVGVVSAKCVRAPDEEPMALAVPAQSCLPWLARQGLQLELGALAPSPSASRADPELADPKLPALARVVVLGHGTPLRATQHDDLRETAEAAQDLHQAEGQLGSPRATLRLYLQIVSRRAPAADLDRVLDYTALLAELQKRHPTTRLTEANLAAGLRRELQGQAGQTLTHAQIEVLVTKARLELRGDQATLTLPGALEYRLRRGAAGWQIVYFPS